MKKMYMLYGFKNKVKLLAGFLLKKKLLKDPLETLMGLSNTLNNGLPKLNDFFCSSPVIKGNKTTIFITLLM